MHCYYNGSYVIIIINYLYGCCVIVKVALWFVEVSFTLLTKSVYM